MKMETDKWQPLPCKVPKNFSVRCVDYLFILVLHETFVSHGCLFKIHVKLHRLTGLCYRPNLN